MKKINTELDGVFIIEPEVYYDNRGYFLESYQEMKFGNLGIYNTFVQDNHAKSIKNTIRGLHYQVIREQAKLCRVIQGIVLDVIVDIRVSSPTFGKHTKIVLSSDNMRMIYIPKGFAHGYLALSDTVEFLYKCSEYYHPQYEKGIIWNDSTLNIDWGINNPILSDKDSNHPFLSDIRIESLSRG